MSIDLRTRTDGPHTPVSAGEFFAALPDRVAERGDGITTAARQLNLRPLVIEVDGQPWTLTWTGERIGVSEGARPAGACVRLSAAQLDELVSDQRTFIGLHAGGQLDQPTGSLADLNDWWLVLRAALDDRPIYTPGSIRFRDCSGAPLDLQRAFRPDDDRNAMRYFLSEAGYLRISRLFNADEMACLSADMDRAAGTYAPGDGRSWWAKTAHGEQRLVRMQGFDNHSAATAELLDDVRFRALAD